MRRKHYNFWIEEIEVELIDFIDAQSNISKFMKELLNDFRKGNLVHKGELEKKMLEANIHYKEVITKIREKDLLYYETFDKEPSYSAKKVIKENIFNEKSYRELTEKEINEFLKHVKFVQEFDGYKINCLYCDEIIFKADRLESINLMAAHLIAHGKKILVK